MRERAFVSEIAADTFRVTTYHEPWRSTVNQYLIRDTHPTLISTGLRERFEDTWAALAQVIDPTTLRYVVVPHFEADECGALNEFLAAAPSAVPVCGQVAALVAIGDFADRAPRPLADGEELRLGRHTMRWFDTPHMPHGWECGLMMELKTHTFLCGDLFTQGGGGEVALTESDILGPSEAFRKPMDYFAHAPQTRATLERFAREAPTTLACMHGSAFRGDGAALLQALAARLAEGQAVPA